MIVEVFLFLALVGLLLYSTTRKPSGMPPGTFGVPLLGNLPPRHKHITDHLSDLKKKYGNIITTKWGSRTIVVLAGYELIKKAFNHPDLQGRMDFYSLKSVVYFQNYGIILAEGTIWSENRRFLLRNLRDLGMGKTYLENSIQEEVQMLVEYLEKNCLDKPMELDFSINVAVLNVIWQMLAGKRFQADDEEIIQYNKMISEMIKVIHRSMFFLDYTFPWITRFVPHSAIKKLLKMDAWYNKLDTFRNLCQKVIEEHKEKLKVESPKDVIDFYLLEMEARKDDPSGAFRREDLKDLICVMINLFAAGSETMSTTIRWLVLYMAKEHKIQEKIHRLLDEVVPKDRLPSLQDRDQLGYLDATLLDLLRVSSLLAISLPHRATATVTFEGYTIPKDTMVIATPGLCHRDPAFWERPDELYPEHFLDEHGKLNSKQDGFLPFSTGRRQCLGESLARMELFLFASALLQRFTIEPPPGVTLSTDTDPDYKLQNSPKPYQVILRKRI